MLNNCPFDQFNVTQKITALTEATTHRDEALLYQGLNDRHLVVRSHAYHQLKAMGIRSAELERGIPLKAGDYLYCVQQHFPQSDAVDGAWMLTNEGTVYRPNCRACAIDAWQFIHEQGLKEYQCKHCPYQVGQDADGNSFEYIRDFYIPDWGYYFDRQLATVKAEELFIEAFSKLPCHITEVFPKYTPKQFDLDAWLEANQIELNISDRHWKPLHFNQQIYIEKAQREGFDRQYSYHVLSFLHAQKRFDLLPDLWRKLGYAPLATINTFVVDHDCYLQVDAV